MALRLWIGSLENSAPVFSFGPAVRIAQIGAQKGTSVICNYQLRIENHLQKAGRPV